MLKYKRINSSKTYETIEEAREEYCKIQREKYSTRKEACSRCVLEKVSAVHYVPCFTYVVAYPEMASLLMGVKRINISSYNDKKELEEAIVHLENTINNKKDWCAECKEEHIKLLEWLKELKELRELKDKEKE